jgi:DNA-binding MarR family transcriptional regulator
VLPLGRRAYPTPSKPPSLFSLDVDDVQTPAHTTGVAPAYTRTQGQYLAFIYYYTKIHRVAPAEADMQRYFQTSPPAIHQMIVTLEKRGFIDRVPGQARSIRLRLTRDQLPDLE